MYLILVQGKGTVIAVDKHAGQSLDAFFFWYKIDAVDA